MKNMTPKMIDYKRLCAIEVQRSKDLDEATEEIKAYEKELRAEVTYSRRGETITLEHDGRVIKCSRNDHYRFNIKEKGKLIKRDSAKSINDIRFLFALGEV